MNWTMNTYTNLYHSVGFSNKCLPLIGRLRLHLSESTNLKPYLRNESQKTQITHLDSTRLETQSNMDSEYYLPPDVGKEYQLGHVVEPPRSPGNYLAPTNADYLAPSDTEYMAPSEASYQEYQESHIDDRPAMRIRPGKELF